MIGSAYGVVSPVRQFSDTLYLEASLKAGQTLELPDAPERAVYVAQGGLTTGLLHALVAMDLPGPGTVFLSQEWKFTAPVYIGDTITARAEVLSVHESKPVTQLGMTVSRADGETVLEGSAWCYTMRPEPARGGE